MSVAVKFPSLVARGGYESFYMRAVDERSGQGVWLRHTFHAAGADRPAVGSVWVTLFGASGGVVATKHSTHDIAAEPGDGWVRIGSSVFGPDGVEGTCEGASWSLRFEPLDRELRHLPAGWLYRAPLPKTKPESPMPLAAISGTVTVGGTTFELDGWRGMVGHNWGTQHAERWIWLHGVFSDDQTASASSVDPGSRRADRWLDLVLGRVLVGGRLLPWVGMGTLALGDRRIRLGGLWRRPQVHETPRGLRLEIGGQGSTALNVVAEPPDDQIVVWRYADPDGSEHQVANCSVSALKLDLVGRRGERLHLTTKHGGTYELGMRETAHGLAVQPFSDP